MGNEFEEVIHQEILHRVRYGFFGYLSKGKYAVLIRRDHVCPEASSASVHTDEQVIGRCFGCRTLGRDLLGVGFFSVKFGGFNVINYGSYCAAVAVTVVRSVDRHWSGKAFLGDPFCCLS